jgi:hypothetical protein
MHIYIIVNVHCALDCLSSALHIVFLLVRQHKIKKGRTTAVVRPFLITEDTWLFQQREKYTGGNG